MESTPVEFVKLAVVDLANDPVSAMFTGRIIFIFFIILMLDTLCVSKLGLYHG